MSREDFEKEIAKFNDKPFFIKIHTLQAAKHAFAERDTHSDMLKEAFGKDAKRIVVGVIGNIAVTRSTGSGDWDKKYPFMGLYKKDAKWHRTSSVWPTIEHAIFDAIGAAQEGINSRFAVYAGAMIRLGEEATNE